MDKHSPFPVFFFVFLAFLVLRLCSVIDWSWWWVTAPLWIPFLCGLSFFALLLGVSLRGGK